MQTAAEHGSETMTGTSDSHGAAQRYIREAMRAPLLSREDEEDLARRWVEDRDETALHQLVDAHARLVVSQASSYRGYGLSMTDLLQEGNLGLMQAAARFDHTREVRFSTYAIWWIRAAVQDFVLRNWSMVRLGTTTQEKALFFNLRRLRAMIANADGGASDDTTQRQEIADRLKVQLTQVETMESRLSGPDQSANAPIGEDGGSEWQDLLVDDGPSPEDRIQRNNDNAVRSRWLNAALTRLPARDQHIIRERHLKEEGTTLADLGEELGISKERVRQIEHRALQELRKRVLQSATAAHEPIPDAS
jgi:RNA polymerase sigma-32 factor